jgi:predicted GNAT family N-acyltransferase
MKVLIYESLPVHGAEIRKTVFMLEQGFQNEFDEIDDRAVHFVLFHENDIPAAACRVFWDAEMDSYILGRLAVLKQFRGQNIGAAIVEKAENYVRSKGGRVLSLHAQCRISGFYQKLGFTKFGEIENDEGCPHIWMRKSI